ncbi:hypothetical protein A3D60_03410 [Candidatus Uhrbacteria bacterium RIFCSPHIGHO2_02_FULL_47_29]|nr:MAG: hypothetical protein A3D60_03410 [Candidatus Uhrbacteria bacterium RIFCSPHIGHO2_02_FULL_47_29]
MRASAGRKPQKNPVNPSIRLRTSKTEIEPFDKLMTRSQSMLGGWDFRRALSAADRLRTLPWAALSLALAQTYRHSLGSSQLPLLIAAHFCPFEFQPAPLKYQKTSAEMAEVF